MQQSLALVLDGHHAIRRAICDRIRAASLPLELVEAGSLDDALVILNLEPVDVVLVGAEASGASSAASTRAVLEQSPASSVIVLGALADRSCPEAATGAGASAVVSKRCIGKDLVDTVARFVPDSRARSAASDSEYD